MKKYTLVTAALLILALTGCDDIAANKDVKLTQLPTDVYTLDDSVFEAVESQDLKEPRDTAESEETEGTEESEETSESDEPKEEQTIAVNIEDCEETVYATTSVNIRSSYSANAEILGYLSYGSSIKRTGVCDNGWSRVDYNGTAAYINGKYLSTEEPQTKAASTGSTSGTHNTSVSSGLWVEGFDISDDLKTRFNQVLSGNIKIYGLTIDGAVKFGYNQNKSYFAASTVKAGYALNLYRQVEAGNINLNDTITYKESMYYGGAGIIAQAPYGTVYTIQDLIHYSLKYSDNIAYNMLRDMDGRAWVSTYDSMISSIGCASSRLGGKNWINTTARDMVKIMIEIYNYSLTSQYGKSILDDLGNSSWNYFQMSIPDKVCKAKMGYTEEVSTSVGVVYGDKPYIMCVSATNDDELMQVISLCDEIVDEYAGAAK